MVDLVDFIAHFPILISVEHKLKPWLIVKDIEAIIGNHIQSLNSDYKIENGIAIHKTTMIEKGVTLKAPVIISEHCKIGANAYFRAGVFLAASVKIGPSSEIKSSIICRESAIAHLNYVGNSLIGSRVNFEAGSIAANHFNERREKEIRVKHNGQIFETGLKKFGALIGDDSKIGANAVLSPGTILAKESVVKRLALIEQIPESDNL